MAKEQVTESAAQKIGDLALCTEASEVAKAVIGRVVIKVRRGRRVIAEDNHQAAEAFLDAIEEAASLLASTPEIGSPRYFSHPELQGLRFLPLRKFENYLLFYRPLNDEELVEIVRIVHGARDLPRLFGGEES